MAQATLTLHEPREAPETAPASPPVGRRYRLAALAMALAAVAVWFAPAVVARSGLRHRIIHGILTAYPGEASVGGASLGWLNPVVLRDVSLSDADGVELIRIGELRTSRTLASFLIGGDDLGTVTFVQPEVSIRLRSDGSNLEDALQPLLSEEGSASGMTVIIEDGSVRWTTVDGRPSPGGVEHVTGTIRRTAGASLPDHIELRAELSDGEYGGELSILLGGSAGAEKRRASEASITAHALPLTPLQPWLDRFGIGVTVAGALSADVLAALPAGDEAWPIDGWVEGQRLRLSFRRLGSDPIALGTVAVKAKGAVRNDGITIENAEIRSDVGSATLAGDVSFSSFVGAGAWSERIHEVFEQDVSLSASLDLARAMALLPAPVKPHQAIESGRLDVVIRTAADGADRVGLVSVRTSDIVAGAADRTIVWREPLTAEFRLRSGATGFTIERLHAKSDFVSLVGSSSATGADLRFEADLDKLRTQLARLIELPVGTLAGQVTGEVRVNRTGAEGHIDLEADGSFRNLSLALGGRHWTERELTVVIRGAALMSGTRVKSIESGNLTVRSVEGDELVARLSGPVTLGGEAEWPLTIALKGDLGRWSERARTWAVTMLPEEWEARGSLDATASVSYRQDALAVSELSVDAKDLQLRFADRSIDESYLRITGGARWDAATGIVTVPAATLTSETAAVNATDVHWSPYSGKSSSGSIAFRGGIGRIARYLLPERTPVWLSGVVSGTLDLGSGGDATSVDATLDLERPVLSRLATAANGRAEWRPVWSDERAQASLAAKYDHTDEALMVETLHVSGTGLAMDVSGRLDHLTTVADADLAGTLACDLTALRSRVAIDLPDGITAEGHRTTRFTLRGPLLSPAGIDPSLLARAAVGWQRAGLFGLELGEGELAATLANGSVVVEPFDWPVGGGRLRGSATILLAGEPALTIAKGRVADRIDLTPEICREWLRYAAPMLADATAVQGTASLDIVHCTTPLFDVTRTEADGVLALDGADAAPGPLARSILDVVHQVQTVAGGDPTDGSDLRLVAPQQDVRVRITGSRVHHDRFTVRLGDEDGPTVATSGSVGFDQTLDLVADVPLDAAWFKDERIAASLGGQTLRVPIRGTLSRPLPDPRALQDLARRAAAGAVEGLLDRQIEKQVGDPLRRLFERSSQ